MGMELSKPHRPCAADRMDRHRACAKLLVLLSTAPHAHCMSADRPEWTQVPQGGIRPRGKTPESFVTLPFQHEPPSRGRG